MFFEMCRRSSPLLVNPVTDPDARHPRQRLGLRPAPEFEAWLLRMGMVDDQARLPPSTRDSRTGSESTCRP
jgi:ethanolamine ammonia-lyase large subunit